LSAEISAFFFPLLHSTQLMSVSQAIISAALVVVLPPA
jgi:hypothetical protein